jgi:tRNA(Leu) C34 or U34 (ribose-2'-O)-methylase TrmL
MWASTSWGLAALSWTARSEQLLPRRVLCLLRSHQRPTLPRQPRKQSICRLKRAGLDYWPAVCVDVHPGWEAFWEFWQRQEGPKQLVGEAGALSAWMVLAGCCSTDALCLISPIKKAGPLLCALSCRFCHAFTLFPSPGYTKFASQHYAAEGLYPRNSSTWLMFGAETSGLPPEAHAAATHLVKIPMSEQYVRSLNLATSVGARAVSLQQPSAADS